MSRRALSWLLIGLLAAAAVGGAVAGLVASWRNAGDVAINIHGWIAIGLAFGLTGVLGGGLMWLAFYSSRRGWDDIDREP